MAAAVSDAAARAAGYCLHPRLMLLSLGPVLLAGGLMLLLSWLFWENAVASVRAMLDAWFLVGALLDWLESMGLQGLRTVLAPLILVALMLPVVVVGTLLLVGFLMTPAIVRMVAARRFPLLQRRHGASAVQRAAVSLGAALLALLALFISLPLWLVPPLALLLPPLIWGVLCAVVLGWDVLAVHASRDERRSLLRVHRTPLLVMGLVCGFLGALPMLLWTAGALAFVFAPLLGLLSVWLYTLVFAFAATWFAHYLLAELQALRASVPIPPST